MATQSASTATAPARVKLNSRVKTWYRKTYPTDDCGMDIDPSLTFKQLSHALVVGQDVYDVLGVGDSIVRERCFQELAELYHKTYDQIYAIWTTGRIGAR